jgi:putative two-component system response regulator
MDDIIKNSILVIDDSPSDIAILHDALREDYKMYMSKTGVEGFEKAVSLQPDLILLDIVMPLISGYHVLQKLKSDPNTAMIPVVFITGNGDPEEEEYAFEQGAVDFLHKPLRISVVRKRISHQMTILRLTRENQRLIRRTTTRRWHDSGNE